MRFLIWSIGLWLVAPTLLGGEQPGHWPQFRGPNGSGVALHSDMPVVFGPRTNAIWRTDLPLGHSSPCVWDQKIFLTGIDDGKLETLCLDRADGKIVWRRSVAPERIDPGSRNGSAANSTPATDGQRVYVYFGSFGLLCYDFAGNELWRKPLPIPITQHGASTSPILVDDFLILACDQDIGAYLLAVNRRTGETSWRVERAGFRRGFSTPMLWQEGDRKQLIVVGTLRVVAYQPKNGAELWRVLGLPNEMCSTPVAGGGLLFVAGWTHGSGVSRMPLFESLLEAGDQNMDAKLTRAEAPAGPARQHFLYIDADKDGFIDRGEYDALAEIFYKSQNALLAIRPGGQGDVTATHVAWKQTRGLPYVPSPLYYRDRLYLVKNGGIASCFNASNGAALYQEERLGALGDYYSSPVAANGKICVGSQQGVIVVFTAGDTLNVLARNDLGESIMATPAIVDNKLYVRTERHLYAFGE